MGKITTITIAATITTPATVTPATVTPATVTPATVTPVASSPESSDSVAVATCKEYFVPVSGPYN